MARMVIGLLAALLALLFPRRPVTADRRKGSYSLLLEDGVDDETRSTLGAAWRLRAERAHRLHATRLHASLALVKLRAPSDLVIRSHEALAEDITAMCMATARAIDGVELEVGSIEPSFRPRGRTATLAVLAAEMLGVALSESLAARVDAKLARRATDPEIRRTLVAMASCERRHARHAWSIVTWCREEDALVVDQVLRVARRILASRLAEQLTCCDGGKERWGVAGRTLEAQALHHALGLGASGPSFATSPSAS